MSSKLRVEKAVQILATDAVRMFEMNQVLPPERRVELPKSGLLKAIDDRGVVVLILNEHVPEEMQANWLKQPITRAHRRRMKKALDNIRGEIKGTDPGID